jgi:hypothetical protein
MTSSVRSPLGLGVRDTESVADTGCRSTASAAVEALFLAAIPASSNQVQRIVATRRKIAIYLDQIWTSDTALRMIWSCDPQRSASSTDSPR